MSNQTSFQFSVNGKEGFEIKSPDGTGKFSASEILKQISEEGAFDELPKSGESVGLYALKGEGSGTQYAGEDQIDLHDEKVFTLVRIYLFQVNGEIFKSTDQVITAEKAVKTAREAGAIPSNNEEYELYLAGKIKMKFNSIDKIDLVHFHTFIAISASPTPVAC